MARGKMTWPTASDGFEIRKLVCSAFLLRHFHPDLFAGADTLNKLIDLYGDYAGACDYVMDLYDEDAPTVDEVERRYSMQVDADCALDFAIADIAGSQVWGAFHWLEGPEWLVGGRRTVNDWESFVTAIGVIVIAAVSLVRYLQGR